MGDGAMGVGGREGGADGAGEAGERRQGGGRGRATRALRLRPSLSVRHFAILPRRMAKGISIGAPFRPSLSHCAIAFAKSAQDSEKDSERYRLRQIR